jgi:hypothetical protein
MRWAGRAECMAEYGSVYNVLVGKHEGKNH